MIKTPFKANGGIDGSDRYLELSGYRLPIIFGHIGSVENICPQANISDNRFAERARRVKYDHLASRYRKPTLGCIVSIEHNAFVQRWPDHSIKNKLPSAHIQQLRFVTFF